MSTLVLVRHGRTTANASGILAGRSPGVSLDETGRKQAARSGERLAAVPLAAIVSSPLQRCRQTAQAIAKAGEGSPAIERDNGLNECDYGEWQGGRLSTLARERLWKVVQQQPSAAGFPGGETLTHMQARAVEAVRRRDREIEAEHGPDAVWVAVSHGDVIKSILADALGMHLDLFQRLNVDPASISVVRYGASRPAVLATNTHDGDLGWLVPPKRSRRRKRSDDAVVGGGAGPGSSAGA